MNTCARCGRTDCATVMSRFNTDIICCGPGSCEEKERAHPQYAEAARAELEAVQRGDYNFPGVGLPPELK
jgi:hypothetical protein